VVPLFSSSSNLKRAATTTTTATREVRFARDAAPSVAVATRARARRRRRRRTVDEREREAWGARRDGRGSRDGSGRNSRGLEVEFFTKVFHPPLGFNI
jgi:hypothetical protein